MRPVGWLLAARTKASIPARFSTALVAMYALVQGVLIAWGGIERWSGPSFTVIRQLPGSPYSWAAALVLFGLLVAASSLLQLRIHSQRGELRLWWLKAFGLLGVSVWSWLFGLGAFSATFTVPEAATTGGPVYLLVSAWSAILILIDEGRHSATPA